MAKDNKEQSTLGWIAQRASRAGRFTAKQLLGYSAGEESKWLDLADDEKHIHRLSVKKQFEAANAFNEAGDLIRRTVTIAGSIEGLNGIDRYLAEREAALDEVYSKNAIDVVNHPKITIPPIKEEFEKLKKDINERITNEEKIHPTSLGQQLRREQTNGETALKEQFAKDKQAINDSSCSPSQKKALIDALEKNHETAFRAFKEGMHADIKIQFNNARTEEARLALFKILKEKGSDETRAKLEELAKKRKAEEENTTEVTLSSGTPPPKKVKFDRKEELEALKNIDKFKTLTDREVIQVSPGVYQINIPWSGNLFYHNGLQDNVLADLTVLALAVRATGKETITVKINGENEEEVQSLARKAYEAAVEAGFRSGTGDDEVTEKDGKKYTETSKEKEARKGNIRIEVNGTLLPLFDTVDKDGKKIKGVFDSKKSLQDINNKDNRYRKAWEDLEADDKKIEKGEDVSLSSPPNDTVSLSSSTAAKTLEVKGELNEIKAKPLSTAKGVSKQKEAVVQPAKTTQSDFTINVDSNTNTPGSRI